MERPHWVQVVTLVLAGLAAVFAFVAMQVAFEARDAAWSAGSVPDGDDSWEIQQLQTALIRAGVIEDPSVVPDDHGHLDGPWARCMTADERADLDLTDDEAPLPEPCEIMPVQLVEECSEPVDVEEDFTDDDGVEYPEPCWVHWEVDGRRFDLSEQAHPFDVEAGAEHWYLGDGTDGVDRVARGNGVAFLHVVGEGWQRLEGY
ncbi:hypothetical protein [Egicoccus sp. AB-alg2]|uniref:hypothetical protein n=1 Tax=Egicoccus sp. AB-alg2 TaxID=3242693 RepID=UPI00359ED60F